MSKWIYGSLVVSSCLQLILFFISSPLPLIANAFVAAMVIYCGYRLIRTVNTKDLPKIDGPILLITFSFILVGLSFYKGVFSGSFYNGDWAKHRAILLSLLTNPLCPTMDGFDLSQAKNLNELRLSYYYAPYYLSALIGKAIGHFHHINTIQLVQWITNIFLVQQLVIASLALPFIFRSIADIFEFKKSWKIYLVFTFYFLIWGGADFWWAKYIFSDSVPLGVHMDGLYNKVFPAQVHGTASLIIWVSGQLTVVALSLAVIAPFIKRLNWPSLFLGFATVLSGSTLSIYMIGLFIALFGLKYQWLSAPSIQLIKKLGFSLLPIIYFYWYYSQRMAPDPLILNPALKSDFTGYLSFILREFSFFFILVALAKYFKILKSNQAVLILLLILLPTPFYLGSYNGLMLKAYIGFSFIGAGLITAIGCHLTQGRRFVLHAICITVMLPLFMNEHFYSNRVNTIFLENRFPIVIQYAGKTKKCHF